MYVHMCICMCVAVRPLSAYRVSHVVATHTSIRATYLPIYVYICFCQESVCMDIQLGCLYMCMYEVFVKRSSCDGK